MMQNGPAEVRDILGAVMDAASEASAAEDSSSCLLAA